MKKGIRHEQPGRAPSQRSTVPCNRPSAHEHARPALRRPLCVDSYLPARHHQHPATDDRLDDGETYADRLRAMLVGIVDPRQDGEISDNEQEVLRVAMNSAWDYLASLGAVREDLDALLNDWDARTADCIRDLVSAVTPDDDRAAIAAVNSFVFGPATRARTKGAVRIAGPMRPSARQRLAIRKAHEKSHSAAMFRRPPIV